MSTVVPGAPPSEKTGEVFTRRWVVDTILDLVGYTVDRDLGSMRIVEPSVGAGAFVRPVVERLAASAVKHGRPFDALLSAVVGFDLNVASVAHSTTVAIDALVGHGCDRELAAGLATSWLHARDFLLDDDDLQADVVVGNPPYIRLEHLPADRVEEYRRRWPTMSGRADIFIGFYERCLRSLVPGGTLGFICADRWMRNQYGARLRAMVGNDFSVDHVWTMHDADAFEEEVSAYPAITVISRSAQGPAVAATADGTFGEKAATRLTRWALADDMEPFVEPGFDAHRLPHWFPANEMWPAAPPARLALIEELNDRLPPLQDAATGTKVGIGIATGADQVFVTKNPDLVEPDRMIPLSMVRDLRSGSYEWSGHYLVNPWEPNGHLTFLDRYPKMKAYLEEAGAQLKARHVAKKSPGAWHRTIDKVNHGLIPQPKLLIQDMRMTINPVLETSNHYPHHNLYFVASTGWDIEVLGGLLLSEVAQAFVEAYGVRMRGGTLRFQAQYLRRIRVPREDEIASEVAAALRDAFRSRDAAAATRAATAAYGLESEQARLFRGEAHDLDRDP